MLSGANVGLQLRRFYQEMYPNKVIFEEEEIVCALFLNPRNSLISGGWE